MCRSWYPISVSILFNIVDMNAYFWILLMPVSLIVPNPIFLTTTWDPEDKNASIAQRLIFIHITSLYYQFISSCVEKQPSVILFSFCPNTENDAFREPHIDHLPVNRRFSKQQIQQTTQSQKINAASSLAVSFDEEGGHKAIDLFLVNFHYLGRRARRGGGWTRSERWK